MILINHDILQTPLALQLALLLKFNRYYSHVIDSRHVLLTGEIIIEIIEQYN